MPGALCERLRERAAHGPAEPALVTYAAGDRVYVWTWAELERVTVSVADPREWVSLPHPGGQAKVRAARIPPPSPGLGATRRGPR